MNLLITGANGQLGNELRLIAPEYPAHSYHFTDVAELDITDVAALERFFSINAIEAVVNCAAYTDVNKAESEEERALLINATAVGLIADACNRHNCALIHISTDYVYNGRSCRPYREDQVTDPLSAYGRSKLMGEKAAQTVARSVILRTSWLYSTFGNNFVKTMLRLGRERDSLSVVFDQTGTPTYAADLASCIMLIINRLQNNAFVPGVFHFSNEGVCSWYDFACTVMQIAGLKCKVQPVETSEYPSPAVRPAYSVLNKAAIRAAYGVEIPYWRDSLSECIRQLQK